MTVVDKTGSAVDLDPQLSCYVVRRLGDGKARLALEIGDFCEQVNIPKFELYESYHANNQRFRMQGYFVVFDSVGDAVAFKLGWENKNGTT